MKKTYISLLIPILLLGSIGATAYLPSTNIHTITLSKTISDQLQIRTSSKYSELIYADSATYLLKPGYPMLPKKIHTFELPFGVTNIQLSVTPHIYRTQLIDKKIKPAPVPVPLIPSSLSSNRDLSTTKIDYSHLHEYPDSWFSYKTGCGLDDQNHHITHLILEMYPIKYLPNHNMITIVDQFDVTITYLSPIFHIKPTSTDFDMVIISPQKFSSALDPLITHKESKGVKTYLKTTESIYQEFDGIDKPEQIKYFIKDAIETNNITYVLLVGGLKSLIWGRARDDFNQGTKGWHVPVRYNNLFDDPEHPLLAGSIFDPGVITDLYYADIYETGGIFSSWDPNGDGIFAAWGRPNVENDTGIDLFPDVCLGRLACRNSREVKLMVNKIIKYEKSQADPSWFKKMIVISGDGFLDQPDLDIPWNVSTLPEGKYTIHAQSNNPQDEYGLVDIINVTIDRSVNTSLNFTHDDHLKIKEFPAPPIAEITSPSEGDILGKTDFYYEPGEGKAYCNEFNGWANVVFENDTMHIRGKSYDPKPYGNVTDIYVWITNESADVVFSFWRNNTEMYYEGEWVTGEKPLMGQGGALYYMPSDFNNEILWASNGNITGQTEVIQSLSEGAGFVFFSGHGSPRVWGDHYPGVPGNRAHASFTGLITMSLRSGPPFFPIEQIRNVDKPFVMVVGGCHNSQFNVSLIPSLLDYVLPSLYMWTYGSAAPECFSWWMTRLSRRGAIATIGNTGLGYGTLGKECTINGLDGGISRDFFRKYGEGHEILGDAYCQTVTDYVGTFDMAEDDHVKSVHQWILLGDPSLMIGGYP